MPIAAIAGFLDDAARIVARMFGRGSSGIERMAFDPNNPQVFVNALRRGDKTAIETMKRMHYGSFYGGVGRATGMNTLAEKELLAKGKGFSGAVFGRPVKGLGVGLGHLKGFGFFALGAGAFEAATAPKGHKASAMISGVSRTAAFAVGDIIGTFAGGPLAGLVVGSITEPLGAKVGETIQYFVDLNKSMHRINMGGNYEDTEVAYTMRQRAAQEMGSSVLNARAWLGKEAQLMHS